MHLYSNLLSLHTDSTLIKCIKTGQTLSQPLDKITFIYITCWIILSTSWVWKITTWIFRGNKCITFSYNFQFVLFLMSFWNSGLKTVFVKLRCEIFHSLLVQLQWKTSTVSRRRSPSPSIRPLFLLTWRTLNWASWWRRSCLCTTG